MRKTIDVLLALAALVASGVLLVALLRKDQAGWPALAVTLPLLVLLIRQIVLASRLKRRGRRLAASLSQLEIAEGLAGVGRWSIDIVSGRHRWSEEFCRIAGLPPRTPPDESALEELLPQGGAQFFAVLRAHRSDRTPYPVEFEVVRGDGESRILRARAQNTFAADGNALQVLMVVRDVTDEYRLVQTMSRERAEAIEQAREAQFLANTDPLTGLANRRLVMGEIDRAILAARQSGGTLSLIMFDIDHFKAVNDTHGHHVGDIVLRKIADFARDRARPQDLVARVGGEEFLWLMPGADAKEASAAAERLRWTVEAGTLSAPFPAVTISIGHATLDTVDVSLSLFARADAALYEAKRGGRNQVRLAA